MVGVNTVNAKRRWTRMKKQRQRDTIPISLCLWSFDSNIEILSPRTKDQRSRTRYRRPRSIKSIRRHAATPSRRAHLEKHLDVWTGNDVGSSEVDHLHFSLGESGVHVQVRSVLRRQHTYEMTSVRPSFRPSSQLQNENATGIEEGGRRGPRQKCLCLFVLVVAMSKGDAEPDPPPEHEMQLVPLIRLGVSQEHQDPTAYDALTPRQLLHRRHEFRLEIG